MKIILFILTALLQLVVAVLAFFTLLLALNGYSERDSTPALLGYIFLCGCVVLVTAIGAVFAAKKIEQRKRLGAFGAGAVSLIGFTVLGVVLIVVTFFVSVGIAEAVRHLH